MYISFWFVLIQLGSILQNSIAAENFSSSDFGRIYTQKQLLEIYTNYGQ
jgi:hypothetical protein